MKREEIREKTDQELHRLLEENRDVLRELRFKVASKLVKDVREIRERRILISRTLTELTARSKT